MQISLCRLLSFRVAVTLDNSAFRTVCVCVWCICKYTVQPNKFSALLYQPNTRFIRATSLHFTENATRYTQDNDVDDRGLTVQSLSQWKPEKKNQPFAIKWDKSKSEREREWRACEKRAEEQSSFANGSVWMGSVWRYGVATVQLHTTRSARLECLWCGRCILYIRPILILIWKSRVENYKCKRHQTHSHTEAHSQSHIGRNPINLLNWHCTKFKCERTERI